MRMTSDAFSRDLVEGYMMRQFVHVYTRSRVHVGLIVLCLKNNFRREDEIAQVDEGQMDGNRR